MGDALGIVRVEQHAHVARVQVPVPNGHLGHRLHREQIRPAHADGAGPGASVTPTISAGAAVAAGGRPAPVTLTSRLSPTGTTRWEAERIRGSGGPISGGVAGADGAGAGGGAAGRGTGEGAAGAGPDAGAAG